jgi:polyphosphate kinase
VRGACILPVDLPQLQGRVRVRSIVGRFLEHSRVFYFKVDDDVRLWLSSADWMSRNMLRRVEIAWPIQDGVAQKRMMDELLQPYLQDQIDAWVLTAGGEYQSVRARHHTPLDSVKTQSAQTFLMQRYR